MIGLLKESEAVQSVLRSYPISLQDCLYSFITRIELLGFTATTDAETKSLEKLLSAMNYVPMSQAIEDATIQIVGSIVSKLSMRLLPIQLASTI